MQLSDVERFIVAANFSFDRKYNKTSIDSSSVLLRYEFTETIVRIAEMKYIKTK